MSGGHGRSLTMLVRTPINRTRVILAVAGLVVTGCQQRQDCIAGESVVELRVPSAEWVIDRFCVDDECLSASQREARPEDPAMGTPVFYSYVIPVSGQPDTYRYVVELTAPDGARYAHEGDVDTSGNLMGGENCKPTSATASLTVDDEGQLTKQAP